MSVEGPDTATSPTVAGGNGNGDTKQAVDEVTVVPSEESPPPNGTTTKVEYPPPDPTERVTAPLGGGPSLPSALTRTRERARQRLGARRRRPRQPGGEERAEGRFVAHRLRSISPWSVLKVAALFYVCVALMFMVASVLLWNFGRRTETIDQFEGLITRLGAYGECVPKAEVKKGTEFETDDDCPDGEVIINGFRFKDGTLFKAGLFMSITFVVAGTVVTMLLTVLLNLLNDVTGGVRYTTVREPTGPPPRSPAR